MSNFYQEFQRACERWPQNVAAELQRQSGELERLTYAELRRDAEALAACLQAREQRGARCALLAANSPRWMAAYLGVLAAGCVAVPLDTAFKPDQVRKLLLDSGASVLFTDDQHLATARQAIADLHIQIVGVNKLSESKLPNMDDICGTPASSAKAPVVPADAGDDDVAAILYTSGTTSDPKGVMLTHGNLLAEANAAFAIIKVGPTDAILGVLPLFHALAQMANLLLPAIVGARVVYLESLNTRELLRALGERDITLFCCVPQFFYLIHQRIVHEVEKRGAVALIIFNALLKLCRAARRIGLNPGRRIFRAAHRAMGPKMRYLITGGSRFDPEVAAQLDALGFEILQAYGLTETSGGACCTPPKKNVLGSVGPALPGIAVQILNPQRDSEGRKVGEVAIRGPIVMKGYYNRPDATAQTLIDGWLHTGDLGYLDARGNLFITGRQKEIIVLSSGKNIYPEEIEAHYQKSAAIKEICVVGLEAAAGQPASERLHAVIVPDFEVLRAKKIVNAGEIIRWDMDHLSAQLPSTKRVLSYEIWQEDLPRTTTRKLKRFEILKRVKDRLAGAATGGTADAAVPARQWTEPDLAWLELPEVAQALPVVRHAAKNEKTDVHPNDSLELDLGLDSMERVELLVALEQALGASVPDSVASEVYTVREMIDAVRAGKSTGGKRAAFEGWDAILQEAPSAEDQSLMLARRPIATTFWFFASRWAQVVGRDLFHLHVNGLENLPAEGAFIICPNHQSYLDPAGLLSVLPWSVFSRMFSIGTSEIFGAGLARKIAYSFHLFPVDPDSNLVPAMRIGAFGLRHGRVLILYPEGERSIDGSPKRFKKGAAILAAHLRVPIYPVALEGFYDVWPRGKSPQRLAPLKISFLDPVFPPAEISDPEAAYEQIMSEVRARIVAEWERLRGSKQPVDPANAHAAAAD